MVSKVTFRNWGRCREKRKLHNKEIKETTKQWMECIWEGCGLTDNERCRCLRYSVALIFLFRRALFHAGVTIALLRRERVYNGKYLSIWMRTSPSLADRSNWRILNCSMVWASNIHSNGSRFCNCQTTLCRTPILLAPPYLFEMVKFALRIYNV